MTTMGEVLSRMPAGKWLTVRMLTDEIGGSVESVRHALHGLYAKRKVDRRQRRQRGDSGAVPMWEYTRADAEQAGVAQRTGQPRPKRMVAGSSPAASSSPARDSLVAAELAHLRALREQRYGGDAA